MLWAPEDCLPKPWGRPAGDRFLRAMSGYSSRNRGYHGCSHGFFQYGPSVCSGRGTIKGIIPGTGSCPHLRPNWAFPKRPTPGWIWGSIPTSCAAYQRWTRSLPGAGDGGSRTRSSRCIPAFLADTRPAAARGTSAALRSADSSRHETRHRKDPWLRAPRSEAGEPSGRR